MGVTLTMMKLDDELESCLKAPCSSVGITVAGDMAAGRTYSGSLTGAAKVDAAAPAAAKSATAPRTVAGPSIALEFVDMYIGHGGEFFRPGTAEAAINNEKGVAALNMMKALSAYMNPDFLTHDNNATAAEWEAGNVALMNFWGSRAVALVDSEGSLPQVHENTRVAPPMTVGGGSIPASALWWDGWTVARNISDKDAAATFAALKHGTGPAILNDETMGQAVWMIDGYKPAPVNAGVVAAMDMGTRPYPMLPYMSLLNTAVGENLSEFMQGKESAEQALADIEAAYTAAAREKGFLN